MLSIIFCFTFKIAFSAYTGFIGQNENIKNNIQIYVKNLAVEGVFSPYFELTKT